MLRSGGRTAERLTPGAPPFFYLFQDPATDTVDTGLHKMIFNFYVKPSKPENQNA